MITELFKLLLNYVRVLIRKHLNNFSHPIIYYSMNELILLWIHVCLLVMMLLEWRAILVLLSRLALPFVI